MLGGLFLYLLRNQGADIYGIELSDVRCEFARQKYNISLSKKIIEDPYWKENNKNFFDVVTLWDVIEHVNFPSQTLQAVFEVLKPGGILCLDTPARDSFYYRIGMLSYYLTHGKYPLFLNMMYSNDPFSHKQIFTSHELKQLMKKIGFEIIFLKHIHELSFPYEFYLKRIFRSEKLVRLLVPVVSGFFMLFRIRNKMVVAGRKPTV